jgi:hypothetical protein
MAAEGRKLRAGMDVSVFAVARVVGSGIVGSCRGGRIRRRICMAGVVVAVIMVMRYLFRSMVYQDDFAHAVAAVVLVSVRRRCRNGAELRHGEHQ